MRRIPTRIERFWRSIWLLQMRLLSGLPMILTGPPPQLRRAVQLLAFARRRMDLGELRETHPGGGWVSTPRPPDRLPKFQIVYLLALARLGVAG